MAELRTAAAAKQITKRDVDKLVEHDQAMREAQIKLEAVATRVQFDLLDGVQIEVEGEGALQHVTGKTELLLHTETQMTLPGVGSLRISPGGEDLADLHKQHRDAIQSMHDALQALGVTDLAAAIFGYWMMKKSFRLLRRRKNSEK